MNHIPHLVALTDPDDVAKVVGDDAQVIAMIVDVGRQESAVAPPKYDLLAAIRGLPIDLDLELVGLDQPRGLGQSLPYLAQEEEESVGSRPVGRQRRVCLSLQSPIDRAPYEG